MAQQELSRVGQSGGGILKPLIFPLPHSIVSHSELVTERHWKIGTCDCGPSEVPMLCCFGNHCKMGKSASKMALVVFFGPACVVYESVSQEGTAALIK